MNLQQNIDTLYLKKDEGMSVSQIHDSTVNFNKSTDIYKFIFLIIEQKLTSLIFNCP